MTAATLYVQMLIDPVDRIVSILDELQMGVAPLARLLGVAQVPDDREVSDARPRDEQIAADDVRFAYVEGRDVLHGIDLDVGVGERVAMVGPSGAGSRPWVGCSRASTRRGRARSPWAASASSSCRWTTCAATSPWSPRSAMSSSARCARTSRRGAAGADDADIRAALDAVDALEWVDALPDGLDTVVGSGGRSVTAAQAQQIALARLVLADPHTLVLDEATSSIDPVRSATWNAPWPPYSTGER